MSSSLFRFRFVVDTPLWFTFLFFSLYYVEVDGEERMERNRAVRVSKKETEKKKEKKGIAELVLFGCRCSSTVDVQPLLALSSDDPTKKPLDFRHSRSLSLFSSPTPFLLSISLILHDGRFVFSLFSLPCCPLSFVLFQSSNASSLFAAIYTVFTSPYHAPIPDHLPTLVVTPHGEFAFPA